MEIKDYPLNKTSEKEKKVDKVVPNNISYKNKKDMNLVPNSRIELDIDYSSVNKKYLERIKEWK